MLTRTDSYAEAHRALRRSALKRNPDKLALALRLALNHCAKAKTYKWREAKLRERARDSKDSWDGANAAALKLAKHLEGLNAWSAQARVIKAARKSGVTVRGNFPKMLRELSKQKPKLADANTVIGPLFIGKPIRELPSPGVVLAIALAHLFQRVNDSGSAPLNGDPIVSGLAWDAAAEFASEALGVNVEATAAKKYAADHRKHLSFRNWPRG